jgi:hypothetical protein
LLHQALALNLEENRLAAQKNQFARARQYDLKVGDLVYERDFSHSDEVSKKLKPSCKGPFRILYTVGDNNARLESILTGKQEKVLVNMNQLKRAHQRRQTLRQYWQETERQALPDPASSPSPATEQPISANNSETDRPPNNERER